MTLLRRYLAGLLVASTLAACAVRVQPRPLPPGTRTLLLLTCNPNAFGRLSGGFLGDAGVELTARADAQGEMRFAEVPESIDGYDKVNLRLEAPGYVAYAQIGISITPGDHQLLVGGCGTVTDPVVQIQLPTWQWARPFPPEAGQLRKQGEVLVLPNGRVWQWVGADSFSLFLKWLTCGPTCVGPVVDDAVGLGFNVLRVFGSMENIAHLWPQEHPDYEVQLGAFADFLASKGMRFEFTLFADAVNKSGGPSVMPNVSDQHIWFDRVAAVLQFKWNAFYELCNECDQNGVDPLLFSEPGAPLVSSRGSTTGLPPVPAWSYTTKHDNERKAEWVRTGHDAMDIRNGWSDAGGMYVGTHNYVVLDEPIGASATNQPGRRSNVPEDFGQYAAGCALFGGCTFHSDTGILSAPLTGIERDCARAFVQAARWVPPEAVLAPYQRGDELGGAAVGNMPIVHFDLDGPNGRPRTGALRTFCKAVGPFEYCDAIRPGPEWEAVAREGWQVESFGPTRGLVRLGR